MPFGCATVINGTVLGFPPPPLSPTDWWDPAVALGAYQDLAKTTPAVANTDPVAVLVAQVGGVGDLVNTAGTTRPLIQGTDLNGHNTILFDGSNDYLNKTTTIGKPFTVVFACKVNTWVLFGGFFGSDGGLQRAMFVMGTSSPILRMATATGAADVNPGTSWHVISCRFGVSAGLSSVRMDNNARVTTTDNTTAIPAFTIGRCDDGVTVTGKMGRVAYYNSALSQADEDAVMTSFGAYYGLF